MEIMNDEFYMTLALDMAERAQGQTHINPVVGCVVVKDGVLVGLGTHLERGTAHAEVHALTMAGEKAVGSTVYVTLEPCSHYGTTPPCSERLIKEGVRRVVVACEDPNSQVAGKGIAMLREKGIEVQVGLLQDRALKLNEKFIKYITTGIPYVTLKTASTLDGRIASKIGDSKWISNEIAREQVHTLRHRHQGIMVGVETVVKDDPHLTTRLSVDGLSPIRIIVDSTLRIPLDCNVVRDGVAKSIVLTTEQMDVSKAEQLHEAGVTVISCGAGPKVNLLLALEKLGAMQIGSILLEGGGTLNGAMLEAKLIDRIVIYLAPKIVGGINAPSSFSFEGSEWMKDAVRLESLEVEQLGDNVCISGIPVWS
ncbi:bifunctional diaminohydroxyphosphoribosylaminopyrimidine deaminase/5-amino-6-(5-phosphoribosylamino)uracil reductase RibD [Paenibacillus antarcticus]|uniref:Riboflavin biosynthesis protein RibD n=1 Tax=Paenibacillus antarcticus TaxID=253703 RepID=A0A168PRB9_9BACL|nr:bifunctional diaminohydroxyphosphoribosylaminopyrimidine deaminase/5-amino-6-(5-phosphoribosylamino)uracil reductase RibD [Paenibacillus antarcticus]OAB46996.1 bifunctional diaminohydroxyphosphoribosylaminopyrimidine deaminase/5-amino-6-(5-phosphoribosylamino)uracil reductase [Paenibacillus antarcticus]